MNTYIARQPIFDMKLQIYAYELLFRSNELEGSYSGTNANQASSRVVMDSFHTMGVDTITGGKPAFVNFTPTLLLEKIATLFPKDLLVIEVLEDIEPTPEIISVCRELTDGGYTLALDDFVYRPALDPLIELSKIIKFDFLSSTPKEIREMLSQMNVGGKFLLAEKVETAEIFDQACNLGFTLFQGYFFSKPVTVASKEIVPLKINYIALLKEINAGNDMNFIRLSQIIQNDVALSYKLLRMVNSAYYGLRTQIMDIKHALAILGAKEIRKWIFLMALMGMNADKPDEIIRISMIRGRFMESIAPYCKTGSTPENMYLTGLFSMIDILLEQPMSSALSGIVLSEDVHNALVNQAGCLFDVLSMIVGLERGEWDEVDRFADLFGLNAQKVSEVYLDAVKWGNELPL